jgi:hypothetical protein
MPNEEDKRAMGDVINSDSAVAAEDVLHDLQTAYTAEAATAIGRQVIDGRAAVSHWPRSEASVPSQPFMIIQDEGQPSPEEIDRWWKLQDQLRRTGQSQERRMTANHETTVLVTASIEGELVVRQKFSDSEMLDYIQRHHTLHKKIHFLYVVDGYEATVTWDDEPMSQAFKGESLRGALEEMMQGGDILTTSGR